ncbi:MAG: prepilin peptidase [Armatimonadetes bacterium]|nr:prepilin peptidase [Armatimonadota bacterium]
MNLDGVMLAREIMSSANVASNVIIFLFGTLFGSFVNVCIARLPVGKSIVWPGSSCGACGVPLPGWQNVPVLAYLLLRGRCWFCRTPFSRRYLLMELLVGALATALWVHADGPRAEFFYYFTFACLLVIVFFVDLDAWIILDEVNYFGVVAGMLGAAALPPRYLMLHDMGLPVPGWPPWLLNVLWSALGALVGYAFFLAIAVIGSALARQEAMGRGDVKFAAMIGAFLGPQQGMTALLLSFPLGALVAVPLLLVRGKGGKTPVPFGTFMAVAAFGMVIYGARIMRWLDPLAYPFDVPGY